MKAVLFTLRAVAQAAAEATPKSVAWDELFCAFRRRRFRAVRSRCDRRMWQPEQFDREVVALIAAIAYAAEEPAGVVNVDDALYTCRIRLPLWVRKHLNRLVKHYARKFHL
jgi:hypothetical protein